MCIEWMLPRLGDRPLPKGVEIGRLVARRQIGLQLIQGKVEEGHRCDLLI
jgi:hypothetical protein